jgi:hypothetical protein
MNDHDNYHHTKAILRAISGVTITLASAFLPSHGDEPAGEPVQRLTPTPTVAVSSAPSVRGSSVALRIR